MHEELGIKSYVALDFETTGLNPEEERIIQIAAIKNIYSTTTSGTLFRIGTTKFEMLVNPDREISEFITNLTGITNDAVKDAPPESEAIKQLLDFIGYSSIIVAQQAIFDLGFLHHATLRANLEPRQYDFYCTRVMTAILFPTLSHSLVDIKDLFDIELENAHNAMSDATATFELFKKVRPIFENMNIDMKNKIIIDPEKSNFFIPSNAKILKGKKKYENRKV